MADNTPNEVRGEKEDGADTKPTIGGSYPLDEEKIPFSSPDLWEKHPYVKELDRLHGEIQRMVFVDDIQKWNRSQIKEAVSNAFVWITSLPY